MHARKNIGFMVLVVGQKCNLKCADCSNFTPLMPQIHYDFDSTLEDLKKISSLLTIDLFQIQGGEVLDWEPLPNLLRSIRELDFVKTIQIATNGTRPLSDQLKQFIYNDGDTIIRISPYPGVSDRLATRLANDCHSNSIPFYYHRFANGVGDWADLGGRSFEEKKDYQGFVTYHGCNFKWCLTIENGVIARCSRGPTAHHIQKFVPYKGDLFNLRETTLAESEFSAAFYSYVLNPKPMRACNFCNGTQGPEIRAGIQFSKKAWQAEVEALNGDGLIGVFNT